MANLQWPDAPDAPDETASAFRDRATPACPGLTVPVCEGRRVAHEVAKLMLEHAGTFVERTEAIKVALSLGMPLDEIQAYLDWLDSVRARESKKAARGKDSRQRRPPPKRDQ